eukprot:9138734-Pyramimonas_sp.AAC.1
MFVGRGRAPGAIPNLDLYGREHTKRDLAMGSDPVPSTGFHLRTIRLEMIRSGQALRIRWRHDFNGPGAHHGFPLLVVGNRKL